LEKPRFDPKRFIFGILFGIIIILSIFLLDVKEFFLLSVILTALSVYEIYGIFDLTDYKYFILPEILAIVVSFSFIFLKTEVFVFVFFISAFLIFLKNIVFFRLDSGKSIFLDIFSIFYAGFLISFITKIFELQGGRFLLLLLFILVWASDIFAYYGGRRFGRHKLIPALSPGKTVEGSLVGFLSAILAALIFRIFIADYKIFSLISFIFMVSATVIAGMAGDLTESIIKRIGDKKDSGNLIPGHGGILDRIDSLILAAPFFYYIAAYYLKF
jgi:phosphatidate cytidylyltransferase